MARTDLETLVVRLEAQMKTFENELKRGRGVADRETRAIEKRFADANRRLSASFAGVGAGLKGAFAAIGVGLGARELQGLADSFTRIQNALKVAGLEGAALTATYEKLFASAQRNAAPLEALAQLYGKVALVQKELNVSSEELVGFTDNIALALRVSGQSAEQSSGALLQLSQALGSGVVRAEEFNSILEGAPTIAQAAAAGIAEAGGSVAKLRTLVIDGKVSSEAFFRGFEAGAGSLQQRAATMEVTIGQALTQLRNAFIDAVGKIDAATGISGDAARALQGLGDEIARVADRMSAAKQPFAGFVGFLENLSAKAYAAGKAVGDLTGLSGVGPALGLGPPARSARSNARIPEFGLSPDGRAPAPQPVRPVSLSDFRSPAGDKAGKRDPFERAVDSTEKRIAVLNAETSAIDLNSAARERARIVAELEASAKAANEAAGLKNIGVTNAQRIEIDRVADAMYRAAEAAEAASNPLREFAREAADVGTNLQNAAVAGLGEFENALLDVISGTATAEEAFRKMANAIIADLARIAIRAAITGPIAAAFGVPLPARAAGGPVTGGRPYLIGERGPELFVPSRNGMVVPNHALRKAGGGITVAITSAPVFQAGMTPTDIAAIRAEIAQSHAELRRQIPNDLRRGLSNDRNYLAA